MVNEVIYQGRLTANPELKEVGGFPLLEFTVAWSKKVGERENKCFLRCKAWRGTAEFVNKYFTKGQEIIVIGELLTEEWKDKEDKPQSRTILNVSEVNFCGAKSTATQSAPAPSTDNGFMDVPDDVEKLPFD